jgi:hypothetical protein
MTAIQNTVAVTWLSVLFVIFHLSLCSIATCTWLMMLNENTACSTLIKLRYHIVSVVPRST